MNKPFSSLTGRMAAAALALHLVVVPLLFGGVLYLVKKNYESLFVDGVRNDAYRLVSGSGGSAVPLLSLRTELEEAWVTGRIAYATLIDAHGAVLERVGEPGDGVVEREDFAFGEGGDNVYHIVVPWSGPLGEPLGELHVGYDETDTRERIGQVYLNGLYLTLAFVGVSLTTILLLGRQFTRPIEQLRDASMRISCGNYEQVLRVDSGIGEIRALARTLDHMRHKLVEQSHTLQHQALHDSLTGLANRALLRRRIDEALAAGGDGRGSLALLLVDLDRFKEINDTLGHLTGDLVLKRVAERIEGCVRQNDTVARLGGDEFAVILPAADSDNAELIARVVSRRLQDDFSIEGRRLRIGASIGIALYPRHGDHFEEILRCADVAMYAAKQRGGGTTLYRSDLDREARRAFACAGELRVAIDEDQLALVFQPEIDPASGQVVCVEALLRWHHPQRGLIMPDAFIHHAEHAGLMNDLTRWVLEHAIRQNGAWLQNGWRIGMAVNLSPSCLQDDGLPDTVAELLARHRLPGDLLELEITEGAIINNPRKANAILERIRGLGAGIAIDDFGTGYSSLAQLKQIPLSVLKVDRGFVSSMRSNLRDAAIVGAVIHLAQRMGVSVVAEGVEDEKTLELLEALGCNRIQGFLISRPLSAAHFESWVSQAGYRVRIAP